MRNIKRPLSRHMIYQLPFSYITFDASTIHLISRHPHPIGAAGIFGPFTQSVWMVFLLMRVISLVTTLIFVITITIQNININFLSGYLLEVTSASLVIWFIWCYSLELRSSLIEVVYEKLPASYDELDFNRDVVIQFAPSRTSTLLMGQTLHITNLYEKLNLET